MERYFEPFKTYLLTEKQFARNTIVAYCADIRHFLAFTAKNTAGRALTGADLKNYMAVLSDEQLTAASMARKIASLKTFYNYLYHCHNQENLAAQLVTPRVEHQLPRYVNEEDITQLLTVAEQDHSSQGLRNRVIVNLLYISGMRISELAHLLVVDINFDANMVSVRGQGSKDRFIPLCQSMVDLLKEYCAVLDRTKSDYLFPIFFGGRINPITRQACWLIIKKLWKKTGIQKELSPHMLRHSLAMHMLKQGADLRSLQQLLGHGDLDTVQMYAQIEPSYLRTIYDKKHPRS